MLSEWLREWTETSLRAGSRAKSTKTMHAGYCRVWIDPELGTIPPGKLRLADLTRLLLTMQDAGRAVSTRRDCVDTLNAVLDDAVTTDSSPPTPPRSSSVP